MYRMHLYLPDASNTRRVRVMRQKRLTSGLWHFLTEHPIFKVFSRGDSFGSYLDNHDEIRFFLRFFKRFTV